MAKKTVAKTSKKKITAPVAYKPTKGRPREYLAYLNEREMAFLRSINGNNMERGPKGLPSFPDPGDTSYGDRGQGTSSSTGTTSKSGNTSGVGGGGAGGGGSTGTRGSSTGSVGSGGGYNAPGNTGGGSQLGGGNKGNTGSGQIGSKGGGASTQKPGAGGNAGVVGGGNKGSTSSKDLGIAGVPGGVSKTGGSLAQKAPSATGGGSKGPSTSLNAPARTAPSAAKSPMSGQGGSFKTPDQATSYNKDQIDRQKTQVNDVKQGLNNTPAAGRDLASGGIKTINVGPMQTPVNVQSIAKLSPMQRDPNLADSIISAGSTIAGSIADAARWTAEGIYKGVGALTGAQPTKGDVFSGAYDRVPAEPGDSYSAPKYGKELGPEGWEERVPQESQPVSQASINAMKEQYSMYNNPAARVAGSTPTGTGTSISDQFPGYKYSQPIGPPREGSLSQGDIAARNQRLNELQNAPDEAFQGYENYDPLTSYNGRVPVATRPTASTVGTTIPTDPRLLYAATGGIPLSATPYRDVVPTGSPIAAGGVPTVAGVPEFSRTASGTYTSPYDIKEYDPLSSVRPREPKIIARQLADAAYDAGMRIGRFAGDVWDSVSAPFADASVPKAEFTGFGPDFPSSGSFSYKEIGPVTPANPNVDLSYLPTRVPAPGGINELKGTGYGTFNEPSFVRSAALAGVERARTIDMAGIDEPSMPLGETAYRPYDIKIPGRPAPGETFLKVETVPEGYEVPVRRTAADMSGEMMLRPSMYRDPMTDEKILDALRSAKPLNLPVEASPVPYGPRSGTVGLNRNPGRTSYTPGDYAAYRAETDAITDDGIPRDENGNVIGPETPADDVVDSPYISPVHQMPAYPEKSPAQKLIAENVPYAKYLVKGATFLGKKEFENLSPREQADLMEKWAKQNYAYIRGGAVPGGVSTSGPGGGITDIGTGGKNEYRPPDTYIKPRVPQATIATTAPGTPAESGERPAIYYSWDVGVNIPSPNDPDYTLYLRYLQERAAAQAALGIG